MSLNPNAAKKRGRRSESEEAKQYKLDLVRCWANHVYSMARNNYGMTARELDEKIASTAAGTKYPGRKFRKYLAGEAAPFPGDLKRMNQRAFKMGFVSPILNLQIQSLPDRWEDAYLASKREDEICKLAAEAWVDVVTGAAAERDAKELVNEADDIARQRRELERQEREILEKAARLREQAGKWKDVY